MLAKYILLIVIGFAAINSSSSFLPNIYYDEGCASQGTYDYIVVGSGAAGSVLANRLSKDSNNKVLLLEAGDAPIFYSEVPLLTPTNYLTPQNWGYFMEKQANFSLGLVDEIMPLPLGRAIGGTSVINFMIYARGNRLDYDQWQAKGNPTWSFNDVLPFFKQSEDAILKDADPGYHGQNGFLSVQNPPYISTSADVFVEACQELGYAKVDYNGENQIGTAYVQATMRNGKRCSAEKAFIRPAKNRSNLHIQLNSRVSKVLIDRNTKKAYGVKYIRNNAQYTVRATKEVILSAGAFHSPQILMLSGIGPQEHLTELNIPILKNLPVGKTLYDHLCFLGLVFTVNKPITINFVEAIGPLSVMEFNVSGTGPLTSPGTVEAFTYFKTNVASYTEDYPDMELIFTGAALQSDYGAFFKTMFGISEKVYDAIWKPIENQPAWQVFPMLMKPKSRGYLKLKSNNPLDAPLFYGNYFSDPENYDLRAFIAAIREVQKIANTAAFQKYGATQVKAKIPGCEEAIFDTDAYWECGLRHISATLYDQTTTCKMGPLSDPEAVVDHKFRVHGINNLRVADTSIIPFPLAAHKNAPSYMIGEKAAADILADHAMG